MIINYLRQGLKQEDLESSKNKRASIVALFRNHQNSLQILFIKRAINPKDLHSGQIAFPGGKVDKGESSQSAAIREVKEEIGVDLENGRFEYIGRGEESDVYKNFRKKILFVCCYVYFSLDQEIQFELNKNEVEKVFWVDFNVFLEGFKEAKRKRKFYFDFLNVWRFTGSVLGVYIGDDVLLWGITLGYIKSLVFLLPRDVRKSVHKDWVCFSLDFPFCVLGKLNELSLKYFRRTNFKLVFIFYNSCVIALPVIAYKLVKPRI